MGNETYIIRRIETDIQKKAWAAWAGLHDFEQREWLASRMHFPIRGGEIALRKTQAALEATRGTQLAATRKVYGLFHMSQDIPPIFPNDEERGAFVAQYRSQPGLVQAGLAGKAPVTFEDLAWWFELGLKGGVTGALRNIAAYDYIFVPTTTSDDLKSATLEWGDNVQAFKAGFAMLDQLVITGALGQQWQQDVTAFCDQWATATFTAALADRTTEDVIMHLTKLAIGNAGASPSSYLTGQFIGFKLSLMNHLNRKFFADGSGSKFTGMGRAKREYELEITREGVAATITERANYEAGTARVARLTATGSAISGATPTTNRTVDIVLPGVYKTFAVSERQTNSIWTAVLTGQYDATLAYDLSATVTNALSALP